MSSVKNVDIEKYEMLTPVPVLKDQESEVLEIAEPAPPLAMVLTLAVVSEKDRLK